MEKYKEGDRIKVLYDCSCKGHIGTIKKRFESIIVMCDCGEEGHYGYESSIELIKTKSPIGIWA